MELGILYLQALRLTHVLLGRSGWGRAYSSPGFWPQRYALPGRTAAK
jgi:hypothetical protein